MPKAKNVLGPKLKEAIAAKGVSQADVARHFGVSRPTVSADWIKHGRIGKQHYPKLVEYFGRPYEWWFGPEAPLGAAESRPEYRTSCSPEARNLASLFDTLTPGEKKAVWPFLVRLLAKTETIRKTYDHPKVSNRRVAKAYGRVRRGSASPS